jgi:molybdate transport system substrate-binding protein
MTFTRRLFLLTAAAPVLCAARAHAADSAPVRIFAAASLKTALDEIAAAYGAKTGVAASISYAATSVLARQIEQGAPCDLFISADREWMDYVAARGLIRPESRVDLLGNTLVLVAPAASPAAIDLQPGVDLAALLKPEERLALADPASVPAGKYARRALESLGAWGALENRIAAAENVRAALAFVVRGAAPFAIVYGSDAAAEPAVRVVATFPGTTHTPIVYPAALTRAAGPAAASFLAALGEDPARGIFRRWGFLPPPGATP